MSKRPWPPDDLPASNGHTGPAAAARPSPDGRRDPLPVLLARRWAVIIIGGVPDSVGSGG
jgi:hypothetical protein